MRPRTPAEKQYIWGAIYENCRSHGHTKVSAQKSADDVIRELGPNTPQPQSAADWLERKRTA